MMLRRCCTALLLAAFVLCADAVPSFQVSGLEVLARRIGLALPDTLGVRVDNDSTWSYCGQALRIRTNDFGDVSHIGYKLFDTSWAAVSESRYLLDFVERYALEEDVLPESDKTEATSRKAVSFKSGNASLLKTLTPSTPFRISEEERRGYLIEWEAGGGKVSLQVQADCQTLLGADLVELEEMFERDVCRTSSELPGDSLPEAWRDCTFSTSESVSVADGGTFLNEQIRSRLYLHRDSTVDGAYRLLTDEAHPWKALNNLLLTGCAHRIVPLYLTLDKYGNIKKDLTLTLQQFVRYCTLAGCKLYLGVKERTESEVFATLFAVHTKLAYCHTVSLRVPFGTLSGDGVVRGTIYAFTPLQNVTEKFFITNS